MIDYIDPVNRLVYLDSSTVDATIQPIDIYRDMRTLRQQDESLRPFDVFMTMKGAEKKTPDGSKRTERYLKLLNGTLIVPYDTSHTLTVDGTIISDTGLEGVECFNRANLSSNTQVDINYVPKQVEIIVIDNNTSGTCTNGGLTTEEHNKLMAMPTALDIIREFFDIHSSEDTNAEQYMVDGYVTTGYSTSGQEELYVEADYVTDGYIDETTYTEDWSYSSLLAQIIWSYQNRTLTEGSTGSGLTQTEKDHLMSLYNGLKPDERTKLMSLSNGLTGTEHTKLMSLYNGLKTDEHNKLMTLTPGLTQVERDHLLSLFNGLKADERTKLMELNPGMSQAEIDHLMGLYNGLKPDERDKLFNLENFDSSDVLYPPDFKPLFDSNNVIIVEAE